MAAPILGLLTCLPLAGAVQPCGPWQWVNPLPRANPLFGVTYGQSGFVAVGALGTVLTSADGSRWTCFQTDAATRLNSVIWDGTRYLAVGDAGTVLLSPDAATWTSVGPIGVDPLFAVTAGGGQYVGVGTNGAVFTSPDGLSWTRQQSGTTVPLVDVTWTGDSFLAVSAGDGGYGGSGSGSAILRSSDGRAWSVVWLPGATRLLAVASNGLRSLVVGSFCGPSPFLEGCINSPLVATSEDGVSWSVRVLGGYSMFTDVIWAGTEFVAGMSGSVATSPDGVEWTGHSIAAGFAVMSVTQSTRTFVAVGANGMIATSPDARQWTTEQRSDVGPGFELQRVARSRDRWVISDEIDRYSGREPFVLASADTRSWQRSTSAWFGSCIGFGPVASNGVELIVPCGPGKVLASPDGMTWSLRSDNRSLPLKGLAWTGSEYLGFTYDYDSQSSSIYSSPDGAAWSLEFVGNNDFSDAASDGSVTVAAGGTLFFKPNGGSWFGVASPGSSFRSVVWGGGVFVAVGDAGAVVRSTDGLQWTRPSSGVTVDLWDVAWDGSTFIAVGSAGTVIRSRDGMDWSADRRATDISLTSVSAVPGCAIAVGYDGVILRNGCLEPRPVRRHLSRLPAAAPPGPQSLHATPR
jgi:hypothetical protein